MYTGICDCGSDQFSYIGVDEVEGSVVVEIFRCQECFSDYERRTYVAPDDDEFDEWADRQAAAKP